VSAISRLVGGSAVQAITLSRTLEPFGYRTTLVTGEADAEEGTMDHLARRLNVHPVRLRGLQRALGPHDVRAVAEMRSVLVSQRPDVLHTHAAKGGAVGRLAALTTRRGRPRAVVHTFHGHVLRQYFGERRSRAYIAVERALAKRTDAIVAVSPETKADLVELGVAPPEKISVIPIGLDLAPFGADGFEREELRAATRQQLQIPAEAPVATLVARLVPIKRIDRFLRVAAKVSERLPGARFLIIGNGELSGALAASAEACALGDRLIWADHREDVSAICFASDVMVLTSDDEGTPVSLIEAHAAGLPAVSTEVGGVPQVVKDQITGFVTSREDENGLAEAIITLMSDPQRAAAMGTTGRRQVIGAYALDRLTKDIDSLYRELLGEIRPGLGLEGT
jgi:glycosyltransferase involved in cell wall biosynthesis